MQPIYEAALFDHYACVIFTILSRFLFLLSIDMDIIGVVKGVTLKHAPLCFMYFFSYL